MRQWLSNYMEHIWGEGGGERTTDGVSSRKRRKMATYIPITCRCCGKRMRASKWQRDVIPCRILKLCNRFIRNCEIGECWENGGATPVPPFVTLLIISNMTLFFRSVCCSFYFNPHANTQYGMACTVGFQDFRCTHLTMWHLCCSLWMTVRGTK